MDIDELINLQWDIENNDDDAPGENSAPSPLFRPPIRHSHSEQKPTCRVLSRRQEAPG